MIKVLFVCLGNICRSPMAEALMRHLIREEGLENRIEADSAGTGDWHVGHPPHEGTQTILTVKGIDYSGLKARQIAAKDAEEFQYIVAMDSKNKKDIEQLMPGSEAGRNRQSNQRGPHIMQLLDLVPDSAVRDVPDPYYTGNFEEVYALVEEGCRRLLQHIKREENL